MTPKDLQPIKKRITDYIATYRINAALDELDALAAVSKASWPLRERISSLRENYELMKRYALDGITDSTRLQVREDIASGIRSTVDLIMRESKMQDSPLLYFGALRYEKMQQNGTITDVCGLYKEKSSRLSMGLMTGNTEIKEPDGSLLRDVLDGIGSRLFNIVWTAHPFSSADSCALMGLMEDVTLSEPVKRQLIGAVMLGAMQYFDEKRVLLLGEIYRRRLHGLEVHALCALLLVLWMQREQIHTSKIAAMIGTLAEMPSWHSDVRMAFLQFIRTRDTERINRTMRDDVIPSMMKMKPKISKIISEESDMLDPASMEDNPEWEELFEKSGLSDKLREISEMQAEGADVMMSTFAHLKSFSFFNDVAHWFLPFFPEQSHVAKALQGDSSELASLLESTPMLCESDKYSMVLSLEQVAGAARKVMLEQIKAQNINLAEIKNASLLPEAEARENTANRYVQDLYRFFTLFRRKNEFASPFASPVNLAEIPELKSVFADGDTLELVAQFYFKRGYYNEAYIIFSMLMEGSAPDSQILQKAGYCMQQCGDIEKAVELYERSELMTPDSPWTRRRLAICYRALGKYDKAMEHYRWLAERKPDDLGLTLNLGNCYLDLKRYDDALKQYFKVEFLNPESHKSLRPIAWCLFKTGQYDRSRNYYDKILQHGPTANDFLNLGHLEMAKGNFRVASDCYRESVKLMGGNTDKWYDAYATDRNELLSSGVDEFMIDLIADSVR